MACLKIGFRPDRNDKLLLKDLSIYIYKTCSKISNILRYSELKLMFFHVYYGFARYYDMFSVWKVLVWDFKKNH
jgi:hypothetical protein